jgi:hypothetical protein
MREIDYNDINWANGAEVEAWATNKESPLFENLEIKGLQPLPVKTQIETRLGHKCIHNLVSDCSAVALTEELNVKLQIAFESVKAGWESAGKRVFDISCELVAQNNYEPRCNPEKTNVIYFARTSAYLL